MEDIGKEFSEVDEVKTFAGVLAPLLATAMHLRSLLITDAQFYKQAAEVKDQIIEVVHASAHHLAIRRIQEIFYDNADRMYRWAEDRRIPANNNLAERVLPAHGHCSQSQLRLSVRCLSPDPWHFDDHPPYPEKAD